MVFFAVVGIVGYASEGEFNLLSFDVHALHAWLGIAALLLSIGVFIEGAFFKKGAFLHHCRLGRFAAVFSFAALLTGTLLMTGLVSLEPSGLPTVQVPASSILPEVETKEFLGIGLTPLSGQGNNAFNRTQYIDRNAYRLFVTGLVENRLNYSYDELLRLPAYAEVAYMPCVEGWGFTAKWTGFRVTDLLDIVELKPNATYTSFSTVLMDIQLGFFWTI